LCWPRFDSDACFAALLGSEKNGRWLIAPRAADARISRAYRGDTMIVETVFETDSGRVRLVDFMPPRDGRSDVIRLVIGELGSVDMRTELIVRFGYGAAVPWVARLFRGSRVKVRRPGA
jgi:GH15 family glucan-1,4-alpha-glucosidase